MRGFDENNIFGQQLPISRANYYDYFCRNAYYLPLNDNHDRKIDPTNDWYLRMHNRSITAATKIALTVRLDATLLQETRNAVAKLLALGHVEDGFSPLSP